MKKCATFLELLLEFVQEVNHINLHGIQLNSRNFHIQINNFCLDSPAKASVCCIVHPTGYNSCLYCKIVGIYFKNRVTFTETNVESRTDDDFKNKFDFKHHKGVSILETELNLKMVTQFPPDYLHVVLLGATKKILKNWFQPKQPQLSNSMRKQVSSHLKMCNDFLPSEIHRRCRPVEEILTYHGNELRVFSLKIGHVVLRKTIPSDLYDNFLLLHCAITILCDAEMCSLNNQTASSLLNSFIDSSREIYGDEFVVSIIHALEHLPAAVKQQQAPLDKFSTFAFESLMTPIRNFLNTTRAPLSQIHRRVVEMMKASNLESLRNPVTIKSSTSFGNKVKEKEGFYDSVSINGLRIASVGNRNRFLLSKKNQMVVCLAIKQNGKAVSMSCRELFQLGNFYTFPINATKLNIYWCSSSCCGPKTTFTIQEISRKCFRFLLTTPQ
jgi:hypothetical protein